MSFDWGSYLILAQELCGKKAANAVYTPETKMRCAISRAYYGAFCSARNYLKSLGVNLSNSSDDGAAIHTAVKSYFKSRTDNKTYVQIGVNLDRLRRSRNKADYDDVYCDNGRKVSPLTGEAIASISYSENIISNIKHLIASASKTNKM